MIDVLDAATGFERATSKVLISEPKVSLDDSADSGATARVATRLLLGGDAEVG